MGESKLTWTGLSSAFPHLGALKGKRIFNINLIGQMSETAPEVKAPFGAPVYSNERRQGQMSVNEPVGNWISASITDSDKAALLEITRQDGQETGTVGNMSATIRRLIRQETKRRRINVDKLLAEQEAPPASA